MTTPRLQLQEMIANQSQPHLIVNAALRGLEVFAQLRVLDKDLATPPGSPADGVAYIIAAPATDEWASREGQVAYYAAGWQFLIPAAGWLAYVVDEDAFYKFSAGSPATWGELDLGGSASPVTFAVGCATSGKPTAAAIVNIPIPFASTLPAGLTASQARAGVPAAASSVVTLYKNGASLGTITFGTGSPGDIGALAAAGLTTFAAGDVLGIQYPIAQDTTLADVGITLVFTRT